jgi:hypothetical protein
MSTKILNGADLANQKIINLGDPSTSTDAANKQYVDGVARGLRWKEPVRAASTSNGTLASAFQNASALDGITLATGDRILLKDQTTATENGIYTVNATGAPTRATDMLAGSDARGATVTITEGTVNGDKVYSQRTEPAVVGTNTLAWGQVGGGITYTAGDGLTESPAGTFNINPGFGMENVGDAVRVAATLAGSGLIGGAGSALAVGAGLGIVSNANDVAIDPSVVARRFSQAIGDGTSTTITVTHGFTRDCKVEVYRNSTPWDSVICDVERPSSTTVDLKFGTAPTASEYRVVVTG